MDLTKKHFIFYEQINCIVAADVGLYIHSFCTIIRRRIACFHDIAQIKIYSRTAAIQTQNNKQAGIDGRGPESSGSVQICNF